MVSRRQSFEEGHRRKFLVVIDDTEECDRAVVYAAKRAERTRGMMTMLTVVQSGEFQHWLGVADIMREEAEEEARRVCARFEDRARSVAPSVELEIVVRQGKRAEQILQLIEDDEDVGILVLAAGTGSEGPGPLVNQIAGKAAAQYPIPVTVVPGSLTDEQIKALA